MSQRSFMHAAAGAAGAAILAGLAVVSAAPAFTEEPDAVAALRDTNGAEVGTVELRQTPNGVLLHARVSGLPEGTRGFHIHEVGVCEPPFETAGDHYAPEGRGHGFLDEDGPHAGDMPNIHVPASGDLEIEVLNTFVDVDELLDGDGTSILVHEDADDYATDPSGEAGGRIACGVIEAP